MPSDRKPSLILPVAVAALLTAGYVGAYYAMVRPRDFRPYRTLPAYSEKEPFFGMTDEEYSAEERRVRFFAPIHWLDRKIRPRFWEPTQ